MEILMTKQCEALTGSLGKGFGYHIQRRKNGFFAKRNSNGAIPSDGHLLFIFACAELARLKTHIADIRVSRKELSDALWEARFYGLADYLVSKGKSFLDTLHADSDTLHANDIINFINIWFR